MMNDENSGAGRRPEAVVRRLASGVWRNEEGEFHHERHEEHERAREENWRAISSLGDEFIVVGMGADPVPADASFHWNSEGAIAVSDAHGPKTADAFQVE